MSCPSLPFQGTPFPDPHGRVGAQRVLRPSRKGGCLWGGAAPLPGPVPLQQGPAMALSCSPRTDPMDCGHQPLLCHSVPQLCASFVLGDVPAVLWGCTAAHEQCQGPGPSLAFGCTHPASPSPHSPLPLRPAALPPSSRRPAPPPAGRQGPTPPRSPVGRGGGLAMWAIRCPLPRSRILLPHRETHRRTWCFPSAARGAGIFSQPHLSVPAPHGPRWDLSSSAEVARPCPLDSGGSPLSRSVFLAAPDFLPTPQPCSAPASPIQSGRV